MKLVKLVYISENRAEIIRIEMINNSVLRFIFFKYLDFHQHKGLNIKTNAGKEYHSFDTIV